MSGTNAAEHQKPRRRALDETLFKATLIAERKRADRSNETLGLLIVAVNGRPAVASTATWAAAMVAVQSVVRGVDIVGWFDTRAAIGVILPELHRCAVDARDLETRVRTELAKRLSGEVLTAFSIQLHLYSTQKPAHDSAGSPVDLLLFPELQTRDGRRATADALKRAVDIIGSVTLLIVLSPIFLVIAAIVRVTSPGPVFYKQPRIGQMMKPFMMLKFRTMYVNCDTQVHREYVSWFIQASSSKGSDETGTFKLTKDARITTAGRLLRVTSLDELPQFWNVLRGEMSLVGPRPPLPYELEQYKRWHCRRVLEAKPGITGLWQVVGRSRTTFDEMVRLDLRYARSRSLWNDLKILAATPAAVLSGKGAC